LHDPIGTDKEGNEISLIDILGTDNDDVVDKVQLKAVSRILQSEAVKAS
jgi:RNA polymerase sporulation-specific sigma factor